MTQRALSFQITFAQRLATTVFALAMFPVLIMLATHLAQAQTFTVLHDFTGRGDGSNPAAGLTLYGEANLYGGAGQLSVFRLSHQGSGWVLNPIYQFDGTNGEFVAGRLTVGPDGGLYGATTFGGIPLCAAGAGCGLVFSLRPPAFFCRNPFCPWTETQLYNFDQHPDDGHYPNGDIVFDAVGNLYGTTSNGGLYDQGTVYELTPSQSGWVESVLYDFTGTADGGTPNAGMVIDHAGNLYGTTSAGGDPQCLDDSPCGVVFELSPTTSGWVETVLHTFQNGSDGADPKGGLIADHSGNLYGTTSVGGSNGGGTVFEMTPSNAGWIFNLLYGLTGNGARVGPMGLLALDSSGNLYGTTNSEGSQLAGNVFKLMLAGGNWVYTDLHDFSGIDGTYPEDGPAVDASGNLYGTTFYGGTGSCDYGCGVVWEITP